MVGKDNSCLSHSQTQNQTILTRPVEREIRQSTDCSAPRACYIHQVRKTSELTRTYRGSLGGFALFKNMKTLSSASLDAKDVVVLEETILQIHSVWLRRGFEIHLANSLGQISRNLRVYQIYNFYHSPIGAMCHRGDILGIRNALNAGIISSFAADDQGRTLPHVCVWIAQ